MARAHNLTGAVLPEIPIFPLPNVVFFPKIFLPLHVFEDRYKCMVQDALHGNQKIGMILLQEGWERDYYGAPPVYQIGCIGKIEAHEQLPQGRFNILLRGLTRFEIVDFVQDEPYRIARVRLLEDDPFLLETDQQISERDAFLEQFLRYLNEVLGIELEEQRLDRKASLESVVNQVAAVLDIPITQKQQLLEIPAVAKRYGIIRGIIDERLQHIEKLRNVVRHIRVIPDDPSLN
ncbi:MAG: LON peptidase substrate-binding domain-containing protein [candidate division KSB1 bacterium]|nr:LON peptidase substrate-binding domain-containing protein [candidate division KSB1 bacterium]MDZ7301146.1 LON peptidase substrate-binding domain-containing protein [candidate division KSB1 bacterium]MDZ7311970.1 LON peptidase substrate-binding domain-containing protein [candidate division KSB1 bacterium]